ncbi:prepilin peptidase [Aquimarina sp. 2304DJ70-9]|uniref:prepilin peptidase n=1 Tax=Aquimarina penaris TaxID=3231044 RepID=UPI00346280B1
MILFIKILTICTLAVIVYQDLKDREVYGFIFPVLIGLFGFLHYQNTTHITFLYAILMNIAVLIVIMGLLYLYTLIRLKKSFFKEVFGWGDLLFFIALAVGFPTVTFVILFVFSLIFSLLVWLVIKKKAKYNTVPLAGYMAVFLGMVFITNWITNALTLYLI